MPRCGGRWTGPGSASWCGPCRKVSATRCGEGGARFSGGQARRLALARVLLSAAPVLVLDEPTAGLDAETERAFLETLEGVTAGRTVILITHRLTGVERPTRILRLAGGRALPAAG